MNLRPPACKAGTLPTELQPRATLITVQRGKPGKIDIVFTSTERWLINPASKIDFQNLTIKQCPFTQDLSTKASRTIYKRWSRSIRIAMSTHCFVNDRTASRTICKQWERPIRNAMSAGSGETLYRGLRVPGLGTKIVTPENGRRMECLVLRNQRHP